MVLSPPRDRQILHFTHLRNVPRILAERHLHADSTVGGNLQCEVGDRGIKEARRRLAVSCGPGGHPCDYVPFYFAPRSPMLYKIARGGVPHYQEGQDPLIYLVATIGDIVDSGMPWVFSNGNCGSQLTEYYENLEQMDDAVDWPLQAATIWRSTADDPDRATRRAAEFLVHERVPVAIVREFVARNAASARVVRDGLTAAGVRRPVVVRPAWYYQGEKYL